MKRATFFKVVLILVAINAAIAIFALLGGDMGETGGKILGTSLLATMGAVLALICAPAASANRAWWFPQIGMVAAAAASALFIFGIWIEPTEDFYKFAGTSLVVAVAMAMISLLSAWPGSGALAWVRPTAWALTLVGAGMIIYATWAEPDIEGYWRVFGVVMVLLAAAAIATPVVHRMTQQVAPIPFTHCPFCGSPVTGMVGRTMTCSSCGRRYDVAVR